MILNIIVMNDGRNDRSASENCSTVIINVNILTFFMFAILIVFRKHLDRISESFIQH